VSAVRTRSVLVVDDHVQYRSALAALINSSDLLSVVAQVDTAEEAFAMAVRRRVDLVVCDVHLGDGASGLVRRLRALAQAPHVCCISADGSRDSVVEMMAAGACGYIHKSTPPREVVTLLERASEGEDAFDLTIASQLAGGAVARAPGTHRLSHTEAAALRGLADGLTEGPLAAQLGVSTEQLRSQLDALERRLGAPTRVALVAWAIRQGLIP